MKEDTIYLGIDDSKRKLVVGTLGPLDSEALIRTLPNEPRSVRRFVQRLKRQGPIRACYETGPSGYVTSTASSRPWGWRVRSSHPPSPSARPGERIKTDRRDAAKLVRLLRAGELSPIRIPDEAEEALRDLVRCRGSLQKEALRWRQRLVKLLDRHGRVYREGSHWTQAHWRWLHAQRFTISTLQYTLDTHRECARKAA